MTYKNPKEHNIVLGEGQILTSFTNEKEDEDNVEYASCVGCGGDGGWLNYNGICSYCDEKSM